MVTRKRFFLLVGSVVATGWVVVLLHAAKQRATPDLAVYGILPKFELIDSSGRTFHSEKMDGKVFVVNFIFTSCPGVCPVLSAEMARIEEKFTHHKDIHFVSISVDPETDTPERLAEYAKKFDADPRRWHFLTGKKQVIQKLMLEGFQIGVGDEPVFHSDRFVLVDGNSQIRGYYSFADKKTFKRLPQDIVSLLAAL